MSLAPPSVTGLGNLTVGLWISLAHATSLLETRIHFRTQFLTDASGPGGETDPVCVCVCLCVRTVTILK